MTKAFATTKKKRFLFRVLDGLQRRLPTVRALVREYVASYLAEHPKKAVQAVKNHGVRTCTFAGVKEWPERLDGFEDLAPLFHNSQANHGLCLLSFEEAAYLYRLVKGLGPAKLAEIGRYKGGSSFLLAAAMQDGSELDSYDIHLIPTAIAKDGSEYVLDGTEMDAQLAAALERFDLRSRIRLHVGNSTDVGPEPCSYDLVFVDGDHSYDGAKADFLHWKDAVKKSGHLLFHDAAAASSVASFSKDLVRLMDEIRGEYREEFSSAGGAGSLVHFIRR